MFNIIVEYKRIKYNRIRIEPSGKVILSVRLNTTKKEIDALIKKYEPWIKKNYNKAYDLTLDYTLKQDSIIFILGKKYIIKIIKDNYNFVELNDEYLYIHTSKIDESHIENVFNKYLDEFRYITYKNIIDKYLIITNLSINDFEIRKTKRTLGRCYTERKKIILSKSLIHKSIEFIEAVVLHEIAHLKYPNHGNKFYEFIYQYMKDYKINIKKWYS
ncbi:SprT-like domain-containing protein [bacterium]|nr:SprT-like domain-containing protein [bacterium]